MHDRLSLASAAALALTLLGGAAPVLCAQSLADVARQEAERRKQISEPAKVYTDKDLKPVLPPLNPPAGTDAPEAIEDGPPADGAAPAEDQAADAQDAKTETEWADGMKERQTKLERDRVLLDSVQNRINSLTTDFTARDDPAQRELIAQDRQRALDELERLRTDIADDQKAITDYEDEARRAGVPPGWLRY